MSELYMLLGVALGVVVVGFILKKLIAFVVLAVLIVVGGYFYLGEEAFNEKVQNTTQMIEEVKEKTSDVIEESQELIEETQEAIDETIEEAIVD